MASQNINVGTAANDGTGESLRSAFIDIRKMFAEVYNQTYTGDTQDLSGTTLAIKESQLSVTNSAVDNYILSYDSASGGFTWVEQFDGDITSVVAGDGMTGGATTDDATLNVVGGDGITVSADEVEATVDDSTIELSATNGSGALRVKDLGVTTAKIANDSVTYDKMGVRFTEDVIKADTSGTGGSAITLDWSAGSIFKFSNSLTGAIELKFDSYKQNQVIDIYGLTGSQTVTLSSTASGTEVFKRIGSQEYDGTADNHIQVICLEDSASTPVFHFAIGTTTADDTP